MPLAALPPLPPEVIFEIRVVCEVWFEKCGASKQKFGGATGVERLWVTGLWLREEEVRTRRERAMGDFKGDRLAKRHQPAKCTGNWRVRGILSWRGCVALTRAVHGFRVSRYRGHRAVLVPLTKQKPATERRVLSLCNVIISPTSFDRVSQTHTGGPQPAAPAPRRPYFRSFTAQNGAEPHLSGQKECGWFRKTGPQRTTASVTR